MYMFLLFIMLGTTLIQGLLPLSQIFRVKKAAKKCTESTFAEVVDYKEMETEEDGTHYRAIVQYSWNGQALDNTYGDRFSTLEDARKHLPLGTRRRIYLNPDSPKSFCYVSPEQAVKEANALIPKSILAVFGIVAFQLFILVFVLPNI